MKASTAESMLDCSIAVYLPHCFPTLNVSYHSQEPGKANVEQIQRLHGTSIIHDAITNILTTSLRQSYSDEDDSKTIPWDIDDDVYRRIFLDVSSTACVLFHRFFHTPDGSIYEFDVWSVSMASVLLATKLHDLSMISVRTIIHSFCSIYRQRILGVDLFAMNGNISEHELSLVLPPDSWHRLSKEERQRRLDETISLPTHGPVYLEWYNAIVSSECRLLHHLGFVVYWIPDHHAHIFVELFCDDVGIVVHRDVASKEACLDLDARKRMLTREAYQLCRKASNLDLCVRYPPELICSAAMQCAASTLHLKLRSNRAQRDSKTENERFWWRDLWQMSPNELEHIEKSINVIVPAISHVEEGSNFRLASHGFIPSKLPNSGSFNDPSSFVWEMLIEKLAADS
jgi:hypothetical protein